jgi:TPP-dependent indolepyruvate ferredoxin oxidoreductase alpha subunit
MAERSFAREVRDLTLGAGEEFRGEGILAITKALLQAGVGYVGGYQGAPISAFILKPRRRKRLPAPCWRHRSTIRSAAR